MVPKTPARYNRPALSVQFLKENSSPWLIVPTRPIRPSGTSLSAMLRLKTTQFARRWRPMRFPRANLSGAPTEAATRR